MRKRNGDNVVLVLFVGGKKPVEHHAAVWVPDNEANVCMHCKRTQFTMLVRRVSPLPVSYILIQDKIQFFFNRRF